MSNESSLSPIEVNGLLAGVCGGGTVDLGDSKTHGSTYESSAVETPKSYRLALREFQYNYWATLMEECGNQVPKVTKISGYSRGQIYKILREIGFNVDQFFYQQVPVISYLEALEDFQRDYWNSLIPGRTMGLVAKISGVGRTGMYKQLAKLKIPRNRYRVINNKGNEAWQALGY